MQENDIREYLDSNGYPAHVVEGGSAGLVKRYRDFVAEVERGYEYNLHNYRNDLDLRGLLRLFGMDAEAAECDERFEALLTARESRVWESGPDAPFWDFGYPRNASRALLYDLAREGLLQPAPDEA